jgi:ATP-dependent DNA helicase RecG
MSELAWIQHRTEGQFFERKSCYDRSSGANKRRKPGDVARDIAETLAAMANADGGTLVVGVEDNGTPTGYDYPEDRLTLLYHAARNLVTPPLHPRMTPLTWGDIPVLVFEIDWSGEVHQLTDGRYLLRVGDKNLPFPARDISAMKDGKQRRATEMRMVPDATLSDLDDALIARFAQRIGTEEAPEELLLRYRLTERYERGWRLTLAALLLFGRDPVRWHPRCGIDFVKYAGTERRSGAQLNIVKRERMEGPLITLIEQAYRFIPTQLRERQHLVDLFFEERLEYPTSAWQEAIVNAVAHRDYRYEGMSIEVWLFDDRMEIRSPGELVEPVTIERLCHREHLHASRNPRIVRVLTDYGYMREQGEGIPRMFDVMEREGLYPPEFRMNADTVFAVTFRNTPIYSRETLRWLAQFTPMGLSGNQTRLLAFAKEHDNRFTSRDYQKLVGIDLYSASRDIKELIRKGIVCLPHPGGRLYELVLAPETLLREKPAELLPLEPILRAKGYVKNEDIRSALGVERRQATHIAEKLVGEGWLISEGTKRGTRYLPAAR